MRRPQPRSEPPPRLRQADNADAIEHRDTASWAGGADDGFVIPAESGTYLPSWPVGSAGGSERVYRCDRKLPARMCRTLTALAQGDRHVPFDLVIDIENRPGALAEVAKAISDAGVNIAAATCIGPGDRAELHILVPHAEAARHALAIWNLAVSREREVVVVEVEDQPGVLADLTRRIARAGIDLDLIYVATRNRIVFGAPDLAGLSAALN